MLRLPWARPTLFVLILGFLVQITGINAVTYYNAFNFHDIGCQGHFVLLIRALIEAKSSRCLRRSRRCWSSTASAAG